MTVPYRVGQGLDVHPFAAGKRPLVLGGVRLPDEPGLEGHSDADVVVHAVVDALLGACGLGDIGEHFGSEDEDYAGADSQVFLAGALAQIVEAGWVIGNVDVTLLCERIRLSPHKTAMRDQLARMLAVRADAVNVKATTADRLGAVGRGEGIACLATVLLHHQDAT